eukprot:COSAG05_NODE_362_length_10792_cov_14.566913_1_plen_506_part_00
MAVRGSSTVHGLRCRSAARCGRGRPHAGIMPMTAEQKRMFTAVGKRCETIVRAQGQIDGRQFIIDSCNDCTIHILDHCGQVTIDDCVGCEIVIGPCADSVYARDCQDCVFHAVCSQWRTRGCSSCRIYLWVPNPPVIEMCKNIEVGAWRLQLPGLTQLFHAASLDTSRPNVYADVYDFTPPEGKEDPHWRPAAKIAARALGDKTLCDSPLADDGTNNMPQTPTFQSPAQEHGTRTRRTNREGDQPPRLSNIPVLIVCVAVLFMGNWVFDQLGLALLGVTPAGSRPVSPDDSAESEDSALDARREAVTMLTLPTVIFAMVTVASFLDRRKELGAQPLCALVWPARLLLAALALAPYIWTSHHVTAQMQQCGTDPEPWLPTTCLLTSGAFAYARHPLYCTVTLAIAGGALLMNSRWLLAMLAPFAWWLHLAIVQPEEQLLKGMFDAQHERYAASVELYGCHPAVATAVVLTGSAYTAGALRGAIFQPSNAISTASSRGPKSNACNVQ